MMIRYKPTALEWLTVICMFPIILFTTGYQLFGAAFFNDLLTFVKAVPVILSMMLMTWYLQMNILVVITDVYVRFEQMWLRLLLLLVVDVLLVAGVMTVIFYGFDRLHFLNYTIDHDRYLFSIVIGWIVSITGITLCETEYTFKKWKESLASKELAELQFLQQEFENLIRQINPHFLFNNLNALSSLIGTDSKKAEYFLDELSKVYRYLMRNNEEGISSLNSELRFINSYFELLKIRYNEAVFLKVTVGKEFGEYLLPSLSLQLLVENAVKHNIARKNQPLYISISVDAENRLVVENNLQKKSAVPSSNHVGLSNISVKYKMLNQPDIMVDQDEKCFRVKLALLKTVNAENKPLVMQHHLPLIHN